MQIRFRHTPIRPNLDYTQTQMGHTYESDGQFFIRCNDCMVRLNDGHLFIGSYYIGGQGRGKNFKEVEAEIVIIRQTSE